MAREGYPQSFYGFGLRFLSTMRFSVLLWTVLLIAV